jgi:hypothetical protein
VQGRCGAGAGRLGAARDLAGGAVPGVAARRGRDRERARLGGRRGRGEEGAHSAGRVGWRPSAQGAARSTVRPSGLGCARSVRSSRVGAGQAAAGAPGGTRVGARGGRERENTGGGDRGRRRLGGELGEGGWEVRWALVGF